MKFKLSKKSRKKQIAIGCAVAAGASIVAVFVLSGYLRRLNSSMGGGIINPVHRNADKWRDCRPLPPRTIGVVIPPEARDAIRNKGTRKIDFEK